MSIPRLILFIFLILLAVVVAALGYLHFANLNQYRDKIAAEISADTGRDFTIGGLDIDLWPAITITIDNITVTNAPWGSQPQMAKIGHFSASVRPLSLLFGPFLVKDFTLENVSVLVEGDDKGNTNWDFAKELEERKKETEKEGRSGEGGMPIMLESVHISNVAVTRRLKGTPDQQFLLDALTIQSTSNDRLALASTGKMLELPLTLHGQIGTRSQLVKSGEGDFSLSGSLGELRLEMTGKLGNPDSPEGTRIETLISSDDLATFIKAAGLSIPLSGPLKVRTDFTSSASGQIVKVDGNLGEFYPTITFSLRQDQLNIDGNLKGVDTLGVMLGVAGLPHKDVALKGALTLSKHAVKLQEFSAATGNSQVTVSGTLAKGEGNSSLQVKAKGDSLTDLMTTQPPLAFNGSADLLFSPREVKIGPLRLRVGASDLGGSVRVVTGDNSSIKAKLVAKVLDLSEFTSGKKEEAAGQQEAGQKETGQKEAGQKKVAPPVPEKPTATKTKYVFSEEPLPFDQLQHTEMDFDLSVDKFVSSVVTLDKLKVLGSLHKGELKADVNFKTPTGGRSVSKIILKTSGQQGDLQARLDARDVHLELISDGMESPKNNPATNLTATLKSTGGSPRALAANSNGNVLITLGSGEVNNTLINSLSGDVVAQLFSALNPFVKKETQSQLDCGVLAVNVVNGLTTIETLLMQDENILVVATGNLDLKTEKLDFEFNTKPRSGVGISADMFVTPFVALRGTLATPSIDLQKTGTLFTLGAAIATGGLSFALQGGLDRITGEVDQCKDIITKYPLPPLAID